MCYERKIAPHSNATLRFNVKKIMNAQESVHQTLEYAGVDIATLSTPRVVRALPGAADKSTAALDLVESAASSWQPLLDKMELFCTVMDGVAEVSDQLKAFAHADHTPDDDRFTRMRQWRGRFCQRHIR